MLKSILRHKITASIILLIVAFIAIFTAGRALMLPGEPAFRGVSGYGINLQGISNNTNAVRQEIAGAAKELGLGWVRLDISWAAVEEQKGQYDWTYQDLIVDIANNNDLKVLVVVHETPGWARQPGSSYKHAPTNVQDYANFLAKVIQRYGPRGVLDYEIWNEPNNPIFWRDTIANPNPNAVRYTQLLKAAYNSAKAVDNRVNIIAASLSPATDDSGWIAPYTFVSTMYANGAKAHFDALSHHPYSYPYPPSTDASWNAWRQMNKVYGSQQSLRSIMSANGDGHKKIWLTEFGAPTAGADAATEQQQANIYNEAIKLHASYDWVGPLFFYAYKDYVDYGETNDREDYFGIYKKNGTLKPGGQTIKSLLNTTASTTATVKSKTLQNGAEFGSQTTISGTTEPHRYVHLMVETSQRCRTKANSDGNWSCLLNLSDLQPSQNYQLRIGVENLAANINFTSYSFSMASSAQTPSTANPQKDDNNKPIDTSKPKSSKPSNTNTSSSNATTSSNSSGKSNNSTVQPRDRDKDASGVSDVENPKKNSESVVDKVASLFNPTSKQEDKENRKSTEQGKGESDDNDKPLLNTVTITVGSLATLSLAGIGIIVYRILRRP